MIKQTKGVYRVETRSPLADGIMFCRPFQVISIVLLAFAFSSSASALSGRPEESVYTVVRIDDLSGLLWDIFSQPKQYGN